VSWARLLFLSRLTAARVRCADVTSVVQEFVAGLPGDAAALGSYLTRQRAVASALASEAAAAAATALRSLGVLAAGLEARRAGLGQQLAAGAAAVATGAQAGLAGLAQGLGQAGGGGGALAQPGRDLRRGGARDGGSRGRAADRQHRPARAAGQLRARRRHSGRRRPCAVRGAPGALWSGGRVDACGDITLPLRCTPKLLALNLAPTIVAHKGALPVP